MPAPIKTKLYVNCFDAGKKKATLRWFFFYQVIKWTLDCPYRNSHSGS